MVSMWGCISLKSDVRHFHFLFIRDTLQMGSPMRSQIRLKTATWATATGGTATATWATAAAPGWQLQAAQYGLLRLLSAEGLIGDSGVNGDAAGTACECGGSGGSGGGVDGDGGGGGGDGGGGSGSGCGLRLRWINL